MIDHIYINVLRKIYAQLKNTQILWAVTGSLGLALQGLMTEIHDIDIQSDEKGAYAIEQLFSDFITKKVKFSSSQKICSHFGAFIIDDIKVEIMGDIQKRDEKGIWKNPPDLTKHIQWVKIEGMEIPVLSLEYEYQAYMLLGRTEKAEKIKNFLEQNE
ncbi:MAG: hypothetical protein PVF58_01715 [Candidatus Methanofastidiosia archaeon]|jgi:hypothetical protein